MDKSSKLAHYKPKILFYFICSLFRFWLMSISLLGLNIVDGQNDYSLRT